MADVTVGRSVPLQPGPQPSSGSISVTQATDHPPIAVFDAYEGASEIKQDLLGNPRFGTPQLLFANVRRYGIDDKIWATRVDNSTAQNVPTANSQGRIQFDSAKSAARLSIANGTSLDRTYASLQTKINFPYQPGRSMDCSFGVQCSRGDLNTNIVIEFGAFDNFDGYGFRIVREGTGANAKDRMFAFRRTSSGETTTGINVLIPRQNIPYLAGHDDLMDINASEQIVEISNSTASGYGSFPLNGNRLDGSELGAIDVNGNATSTGYKLSLHNSALSAMNLTMFRIRYSWYGASGADFWAYVPLNKTPKPGQPRWVKMHSFPIGDSLQFPSLKNPDKPLTFRIYRRADATGLPNTNAFLSTFGTSFSIDAGDPSPVEIYSAASQVISLSNTNPTPIMAIQIKPYIMSSTNTIAATSVQTPNQLRAYPLQLSISSTAQAAFSLVKNPNTFTGTFPTPVAGDLSAISTGTALGTNPTGNNPGKVCGTFYCGTSDGQTINLTDIFSYNREYLAREAQASANTPGDTLYVVATLLSGSSATVSASLVWGQQ
jgi:hypothetical protein